MADHQQDISNADGVSPTNKHGILHKMFASCAPDPRGSVHRAWGIMVSLHQSGDASVALVIAVIWTGLIHLALGVLGTFVLKRFPTSFSVGFFLGVLVVLANQNILLYASFHKYTQGSSRANQVFASLGFVLFAVLTFMSLLLVHFKQDVVISPMDTLGSGEDDEGVNSSTAPGTGMA
eukprot:jgi/Psemu1/68069/estExt_Genemark1.C_4270009